MDRFEQRIAEAVNEKLNDGTVEKLIEQHIEKAVSQSLDGIFGYSGSGRKMIQSKLDEVMVPVIENHDFNKYIVKLDNVLSEIINNTSLKDNKVVLENFKRLMKELIHICRKFLVEAILYLRIGSSGMIQSTNLRII